MHYPCPICNPFAAWSSDWQVEDCSISMPCTFWQLVGYCEFWCGKCSVRSLCTAHKHTYIHILSLQACPHWRPCSRSLFEETRDQAMTFLASLGRSLARCLYTQLECRLPALPNWQLRCVKHFCRSQQCNNYGYYWRQLYCACPVLCV